MTPHTQAFLHDPDAGLRDDCYRTAVACVLDVPRDEVPHAPEDWDTQEGTVRNMREFLGPRGFAIVEVPVMFDEMRHLLGWMHCTNGPCTYLLSGRTERGTDHVVVVHGEREVWDPHPSRAGLFGPLDSGYWLIGTVSRR